MTATVEESIEQIDLSDLDLLDNETHHAFCDHCYPLGSDLPPIVIALCGVRVVADLIPSADSIEESYLIPADACKSCITTLICSRCGRVA